MERGRIIAFKHTSSIQTLKLDPYMFVVDSLK